MPARCRRRSPARPFRSTGMQRQGSWVSPADAQLDRRGVGPRLRARDAGGGDASPRCICRGWPRKSCSGARAQFGFIRLSDRFTTGSSIMPQKRNPDAAELVRAKPGRILGAFTALIVVMKGLPMTYSKDMQEDKEPFFDAVDSLMLAIAAMTGMIQISSPMWRGCARQPQLAMRRRQISRTGWSPCSACRFARRIMSPVASWPWPTAGGQPRRPRAGRSSVGRAAHHRRMSTMCSMWKSSVASRCSFGGTAAHNVHKEAERWLAELGKER